MERAIGDGGSLAQMAQDLEALSMDELKAAVEYLPVNRVLDLLVLYPVGSAFHESIRQASMSFRLIRAISDDPDRLVHLWRSLNQLAHFRYGRSWLEVEEASNWNTHYMFDEAGSYWRARDMTRTNLQVQLQRSIAGLLGLHLSGRSWVVEPESQAAFHYLPPDSVLSGISGLDVVPGEETASKEFANALARRLLDPESSLDVGKVISELHTAYSRLFRDQSDQLERLAGLYERFPRLLKVFNAPEHPAKETHVLNRLRRDAKLRRQQPFWNFNLDSVCLEADSYGNFEDAAPWQDASARRPWYRFRYPHSTLVPFEWCLRLFKTVVERKDSLGLGSRLPSHLRTQYDRALDGVDLIYCHTPGKRLRRTTGGSSKTVSFAHHFGSRFVLPKPEAEMDWLESFVTVTEWMAAEFPDIKKFVASAHVSVWRWRGLVEPMDYKLFVENESPRVIARQLQADSETFRRLTLNSRPDGPPSLSSLPSLLAFYLPPSYHPKAKAIAKFLPPRNSHRVASRIMYESRIEAIREALRATPQGKDAEQDGWVLVADQIDEKSGLAFFRPSPVGPTDISEDDLATTAETLKQLFEDTPSSAEETGNQVLARIMLRLEEAKDNRKASNAGVSWKSIAEKYAESQKKPTVRRSCYICGRYISRPHAKPHPTMSSMCVPCGNFNLAASELSMPPRLSLAGKVAAVTGARVNLGYHVTLRLLRCGARVVASTRYPYDALSRYQAEGDAHEWIDRLRIVGADFRSAKDAFQLATVMRAVVKEWGGVLHILINNAAQTLTDSIEKEKTSVNREETLGSSVGPSRLLPPSTYKARIRAGNMAGIEGGVAAPQQLKLTSGSPTQTEKQKGSSWVQSISDIPYEDVISAHSVNAFVPLILIRELMPLMCEEGDDDDDAAAAAVNEPQKEKEKEEKKNNTKSRHARGYVVNVSSREGIFEHTLRGSQTAKNGRHVHTNMSKAALNMITETEAGPAWDRHRVAINTVDPGYMSAAPEFDAINGGERPIGWDDGAGRVLWPVAVGELEKSGREEGCRAVWGRFLKHYGAARVNAQQGLR